MMTVNIPIELACEIIANSDEIKQLFLSGANDYDLINVKVEFDHKNPSFNAKKVINEGD